MATSILFPDRPQVHTFANSIQVTITHNKGYFPQVQILVNDTLVYADIRHVSINECVITFINSTTGTILIR